MCCRKHLGISSHRVQCPSSMHPKMRYGVSSRCTCCDIWQEALQTRAQRAGLKIVQKDMCLSVRPVPTTRPVPYPQGMLVATTSSFTVKKKKTSRAWGWLSNNLPNANRNRWVWQRAAAALKSCPAQSAGLERLCESIMNMENTEFGRTKGLPRPQNHQWLDVPDQFISKCVMNLIDESPQRSIYARPSDRSEHP